MTPDAEYRHQALQIRQSARARLSEIRQAQLWRDHVPGGPGPDPAEDRLQKLLRRAERLAGLSRQTQMAAGTEKAREQAVGIEVRPEFSARWRETDIAPPGEVFGPPYNPPPPVVSPEAGFGPQLIGPVQGADPLRSVDTALLTLSAEMRVGLTAAPDQAEALAIAPIADLADACAADLMALPGAGPGLIWMLQQCGITTLADLAQTDAAALIPKLGLVGQIVDVQAWQRFARRQVVPRAVAG